MKKITSKKNVALRDKKMEKNSKKYRQIKNKVVE